MVITVENKRKMVDAFKKLQTTKDLLALLNTAKKSLYGRKTMVFTLQQLTWYSNPAVNQNRYKTFSIRKKSGALRIIHAPVKGLKAIQECLNLILQVVYEKKINPAAKGFISGRNIVHNAQVHVGNTYVYNIDLKDFFPSIDQARIWKRLQLPPFSVNERTAQVLAALCCTRMEVERIDSNGQRIKVMKNVLPQGAPTSPVMSNIICQQLDYYLSAVSRRFNLKYSRYADDITFSSMHNVYQPDGMFIQELHKHINQHNFIINETKTRLQKQKYRQEVTGLIVNKKANVPKRYIRDLRMWLYYLEQYGFEKTTFFFEKSYLLDKGHVTKQVPVIENVLAGKLDYLKMVKGESDSVYKKLQNRWKLLVTKEDKFLLKNKKQKKRKEEVKTSTHIKFDLRQHRPLDVAHFLNTFRRELKYLTHDYDISDPPFVREIILAKAKKEFDRLIKDLTINKFLRRRIECFAFDEKAEAWFYISPRRVCWHSQRVIEWTKENPGMHPINSDELGNEMFEPFKDSIEFKAPQLYKAVRSTLENTLKKDIRKFNIDDNAFVGLKKAAFYTDVPSFQNGLTSLFKAIQQRASNSCELLFEYVQDTTGDRVRHILTIIHLNSVCDKVLEEDIIIKGDLDGARTNFFGICDWSIIAKTVDGNAQKLDILYTWDGKKRGTEKIDPDTVRGFTHILTFYA